MENSITVLTNTISGSEPSIIAELYDKKILKQSIYVVENELELRNTALVLSFFIPNLNIILFPEWDTLPYKKMSPSISIMTERMKSLHSIIKCQDQPFVVIATASAVIQKVLSKEIVENSVFQLQVGKEIKIDHLVNYLVIHGYNQVSLVSDVGDFSVRGSLVDIFVATHDHPIRIDFFGYEVESIKTFDINTQITNEENIESLLIYSASEVIKDINNIKNFQHIYEQEYNDDEILKESIQSGHKYIGEENWLPLFYENGLCNIFDYLQSASIICNEKILCYLESCYERISDGYCTAIQSYKQVSPNQLYINPEYYSNIVKLHKQIIFSFFDSLQASAYKNTLNVEIANSSNILNISTLVNFKLLSKEKKQGIFQVLLNFLQNISRTLIIACYSQGFLDYFQKQLKEHNIFLAKINKLSEIKSAYNIAVLPIKKGYITPSFIIISERDLFDTQTAIRNKRGIKNVSDDINLKVGDVVVHKDYGIGCFIALETLKVLNSQHDFIKIMYRNDDKLFLPVENINLITKYGESDSVILDKLGSSSWQERHAKVKKRIKDIAKELLEIEAARQLLPGKAFEIDKSYKDFCSEFPYVETDDQLNAILDVENDLLAGKVMDRLVCGDVGFGKTEVALRAAFLATTQKVQVAVIVPTTLLCRQHFAVFTERFKKFGNICIKQLSRVVSKTEAKKVKQDLFEGKMNIIIGTHSLLSKDIQFFDLGLIIIDEEQHFGVKQKEVLKQLKKNVHVLSLSATPIPRTLHMSLSGIKDLSIIKTPPIGRLAVKTFITYYDSELIKEAIIREYNRGGRVFYVCPFIKDIEKVHEKLTKLIPEIKIDIAHGKISSDKLDRIMNDFFDGKFVVLLTTAIVESGIDIPFANTIIIHNAEMFGLAQLYQLRGRVGRSKVQGYAYFIVSEKKLLSKETVKRLESIKSIDEVGSGFSISLHDMDIRGFGNLVGEEQSGHVKEVGIELYQQMLMEEIKTYKDNKHDDLIHDIKIDIDLNVRIPNDYIEDLNLKMKIYKKIGSLRNKDEIDNYTIEIINRFGKLPDEVKNLLNIIYIRQLCVAISVYEVELIKNIVVLKVSNSSTISQKLLKYLVSNSEIFQINNDSILILVGNVSPAQAVEKIILYLTEMNNIIKE